MSTEQVVAAHLRVGDELVFSGGTVAEVVTVKESSDDSTSLLLEVRAIDPADPSPTRSGPADREQAFQRLILEPAEGAWETTIQASEARMGAPVKSFYNSIPAWIVGITEDFTAGEYTLLLRDTTTGVTTSRSYAASDPLTLP